MEKLKRLGRNEDMKHERTDVGLQATLKVMNEKLDKIIQHQQSGSSVGIFKDFTSVYLSL